RALQAASRAEQRAIPAKGVTGPGYDGHAFWDTESFVLPVLIAAAPRAAADALRWRHSTLDLARERAQALRMRGAAFPWRTIRGQECSGYWPAGTAALHINADVAAAAMRYVYWTGDDDFDRDTALPLLVETARLWASLGYHGDDGAFHLDGVTGPDEYSALAEDNARAFAYYEPLTVRDSSLSACTQAVLAAETGHLELAHDYLSEAALMDLHDLEHNARDGLHIASLAGSWIALVAGFGGMRDHGGQLSFCPQLPPGIGRLSFALRWRGATVHLTITA